MTTKQLNDIKARLAQWREERFITIQSQEENFNSNFLEELGELVGAIKDKDEYFMIDSLCDMIVVMINANKEEFSIVSNTKITLNDLTNMIKELGYDPYECLLETLKELNSRTGEWSEANGKWQKYIGAYCPSDALSRLKNTYLAITIKGEDKDYWEFECRGEDGNKVIEKIKKWYQADYSTCKIEEE